MVASKRDPGAATKPSSQLTVQVAIAAAVVLFLVGWSSQRSSDMLLPPQPQLYVNDLSLPLDVGVEERQVRAAAAAGRQGPCRRAPCAWWGVNLHAWHVCGSSQSSPAVLHAWSMRSHLLPLRSAAPCPLLAG